MTDAPKSDETKLDLDEAKLAGVVKRMLNTPPTPHKPKPSAKAEPARRPVKLGEKGDQSGKQPKAGRSSV